MARASKYKPEYDHMAEVACREGGFTGEKLAKLFSVARSTTISWAKENESFRLAVQRGKDHFDVQTGEKALVKAMTGSTFKEITRERIGTTKDGKTTYRMTVTKCVEKHVPINTTALIFHLTNRSKDEDGEGKRWQHLRNLNLSGHIRTKNETLDFSELSEEQLEALAKIKPMDTKAPTAEKALVIDLDEFEDI